MADLPENTDPGHLTEFYAGFNGTCGECALEDAMAAASDTKASEDDMVAVTHEMQHHGQADPNGASTLWGLAREAERRGFEVLIEWDYANPLPHDWHTVLIQNAGVHPIVLQHANGQALHDAETGAADEVGLQQHFTAIINKQADGYVDNDGDNYQVLKRYQVYNIGTLFNSQVAGLLMIAKKAPVSQPPTEHVPAGWKDDGKTLTAPNGHVVVNGFRALILGDAGYDPADQPLESERPTGTNSAEQIARFHKYIWDGTHCFFWSLGEQLLALLKAPAPGPAPIPASVHAALMTATQLLAPFVACSAEVAQATKDVG
jgi:hypothetical protein